MLALLALLAVGPSEPTLDVPLYVGADIDEEVLAVALAEVEQIFAPGGIRLRFSRTPATPIANPTVIVILQPHPAIPVIHGCSRNLHDHRLGHTNFGAKRITLWSEQIMRAIDGDWDRRVLPNVSKKVYARALGRVLAHELGHFLLRLNGHRDHGLMRASFSQGSLRSRSNRAFRMSVQDLAKMRAALDRTRANAGTSY